MFNNLKAEIARLGMDNAKFAAVIKMNSRLFNQKISGKSEFKQSEMQKIKNALGNDENLTLEYLFDFE